MRMGYRITLTLLLLTLPLPLMGSAVLRLTFQDMVEQASGIVHGQVVSQHSRWEVTVIATYVELDIIDCHKGPYSPGDRIVIYQHGGVVGDLTMLVYGEPRYRTGEEVFLFLEDRTGAVEPLVLGMAQGKFNVVMEPESGRRIITRTMRGLDLVENDETLMNRFYTPSTELEIDEATGDSTPSDLLLVQPLWIPLDQFEAEIERLLPSRGAQ